MPRPVRGLLPVAICALAAHAVAYGSFLPQDGLHGYFGWYEPLVAALSIGSLALLAVALVANRLGLSNKLLQGVSGRETSVAGRAGMLAVKSLGFLLVQETLERVLAGTAPAFSGTTLLLMVLGVALFATLLAFAGRTIARLVLDRDRGHHLRRVPALARPETAESPRRRNPLADRRGLRAPPLATA